jgi:Ca2+-binding EF-hand superfamily protein
MSSDENENDNDLKSNSYNQNLNELNKLTNFTLGQITSFHKYFRKCKLKSNKSNSDNINSDLLNKEEFKNSLGVLSTKSCDYISNRLFHVISGENSEYISFREYILYLDLVNYGSKEDKLKHCFKLFDIGNKGFITNKDFTNILYNLCLFISSLTISQVLVNETELSGLYDYYINKAKIQQLDFSHFKILLDNFPNFLDFYDIFNNNIYYEMNFMIKKEHMEKLVEIKDKLYELKNILNISQIKNSSVSLVTEDYIDDVLEQKKDIGNISSISLETKNNGIENNNVNVENHYVNFGLSDYLLFSRAESEIDNKSNGKVNSTYKKIQKDKKMYVPPFPKDTQSLMSQFNHIIKNSNTKIQKKNEKLNDTIFDLSESSFENDNLDNSSNSLYKYKNTNNRNNSTRFKKSILKNSSKEVINKERMSKRMRKRNSNQSIFEVLEKKKKKFHFLKPFTNIKDEKLSSQLKKYGYDLNNTLILSNKNNFQSFIDDIITSLANLINSILPDNMKSKKRQGISLGQNFEFDLGKIKKVRVSQDNEVQKNIIHFGNPNLKTVINIMIGIKSAVSKIGEIPIKSLDIKVPYLFPVDNLGVYEEMNRFMYEQNNYDGVIKCKFYDFAPKIFYNLRNLYGISNDDYLKSLGPENFLCNLIITKNKSLKEICSSGKSGSFFYYSYDSKYLMKTIPESEFIKFREMLQDYYLYMYEHPKTLLQRFFGLYMCLFNDTKMHFVVMNNVFNTPLKVHYKYDLKGSTYKRMSRKCKEINYDNYDFDIAMKDNDFTDRNEKIDLSPYYKKILFQEAKSDSKFLSDHNINDYSFLIGVYDKNFINKEQLPQEQLMALVGSNLVKPKKSFNQNNVARKPFYEEHYGGIQSEDNTKVYFFGIIDIFTNYGATKKVEYIVKSVSQGNGISCKPPDEYSKRFINFVDTILNSEGEDNKIENGNGNNKNINNYNKEDSENEE